MIMPVVLGRTYQGLLFQTLGHVSGRVVAAVENNREFDQENWTENSDCSKIHGEFHSPC